MYKIKNINVSFTLHDDDEVEEKASEDSSRVVQNHYLYSSLDGHAERSALSLIIEALKKKTLLSSLIHKFNVYIVVF